MMILNQLWKVIWATLVIAGAAYADEWPRIEQPIDGVSVVYDDFGGPSMDAASQVNPNHQIRKIIDLSGLPKGILSAAKEARLRVYLAIEDISWKLPKAERNGLDESFELHINGHVHTYRTNAGFAANAGKDKRLKWRWHDFIVPVDELVAGRNVFVFKKAANGKPKSDDYLRIQTDLTESHGNSEVSFDGGKTWRKEKCKAIDAPGEYMVRLMLIAKDLDATATWHPQIGGRLDDPAGLVGYTEFGGKQTATGLRLTEGARATLEFDGNVIDQFKPVSVAVQFTGATPQLTWANYDGDPLKADTNVAAGRLTSVVPAKLARPAQLTLTAPKEGHTELRLVTVKFSRPPMETEPVFDMAPRISPPKGGPIRLTAECRVLANEAILEDSLLKCRLETSPRLRMKSLVNRWVDRDMLLDPEQTHLFLVEIGDERFGAEDFVVRKVTPLQDAKGLVAELFLPDYSLAARLKIALAQAGQLRFGLRLTNEGNQPLDFRVAFPHMGGLALSDDWQDDYYLFPYTGGVIADVPTYLRSAYGEDTAWWQMIDLFSPASGGGLSLRCLDETGLYKCPVLRKGKILAPGCAIVNRLGRKRSSGADIGAYMTPEMYWTHSLEPGTGTAMTFEYIKRTRRPGESFAPPDTMVAVHQGDFHVAMSDYSKWAHTVWKWRPFPSKLHDCFSAGSTFALYKDGAYRTDFLQQKGPDQLELWNWWEWAEVGPWRVPLEPDQLKEKLGKPWYDYYSGKGHPGIKINPATGKLNWARNCGDYKYHEEWGGLPAFREYIQTIRDAGVFPTFYMEGILACDSTEVGHKFGPKYGVINPMWRAGPNSRFYNKLTPKGYFARYSAYNMCADTKWWQDYLARTVKRVCADTGISGVRLDQFGHKGSVCQSTEHEHMFAEPGHNAWLQAVSEACRKVHAAMDEVSPDLVLSTEFVGYDHLARYLDASGMYMYGQHRRTRPIRPIPCNLFHFYFPECRVYNDRSTRHVDWNLEWKFWNAIPGTDSSGLYPPKRYRILRENVDLFDTREREPFIPTLVERVYANRFTSESKQITLLFNARGHTVAGPLLPVKPTEGHHFFELLRCEELTPVEIKDGHAIWLKLGRHEVACIARLPKRLTVMRDGDRLEVQVDGRPKGLRVVLVDGDGKALSERPAAAKVVLTIPETTAAGSQPVCVKLLGEKYLVDVAAVQK